MGKSAPQNFHRIVHALATLQHFGVVVVAIGVRGVLRQKFFKPLQRQLQFIGGRIFLRNAVYAKVVRGFRGVQLLQLLKSGFDFHAHSVAGRNFFARVPWIARRRYLCAMGTLLAILRFTSARRLPAHWPAKTLALWVLSAFALFGCLDETYIKEDRTDKRAKTLKLTHHVGGTHDCVLVKDGVWYVGFGPQLLVLEGRGKKILRTELVNPSGDGGPLTNLILWHGDLIGVISGDAVVRWDISTPRQPLLIDLVSSKELGIRPRAIQVVNNKLYISGDGGVVSASDGKKFLAGEMITSEVVATKFGAAVPVARRVQLLENNKFIAAASVLEPLPPSAELPGGFAFALIGKEGATVGLMNADLHEVFGEPIRGTFRSLTIANGRLWAIFDTEIISWEIKTGKLNSPVYTAVKGARDLAPLSDNLYAVTGSFGRGVFHLNADKDGEGDSFTDAVREPGRLEQSLFDGRRILAGSYEGFWLYPIRGKPTMSDKSVSLSTIPDIKVAMPWAEAQIEKGDGDPLTFDEGKSIHFKSSSAEADWELPPNVYACVLASVDGDLWVGHTDGITVLRPSSAPSSDGATVATSSQGELVIVKRGELRLPGPILWIHPLRTGLGAVWVSHFGGMGLAEFTPDEPSLQPVSKSSSSSTLN